MPHKEDEGACPQKDLLASKGMLPGAEMRSGKPRHSWSVIWQRIQRIMVRVSTSVLNTKGKLKKMHTSHPPCSPGKEDRKSKGKCHGEG